MFVIFLDQVLNRSSLQGNGHGLACKLRGFALGDNSYVPIEQTEEVNIPNLYNTFTLFRPELLRRATMERDVWATANKNVRGIGAMLDRPTIYDVKMSLLRCLDGVYNFWWFVVLFSICRLSDCRSKKKAHCRVGTRWSAKSVVQKTHYWMRPEAVSPPPQKEWCPANITAVFGLFMVCLF